MKHKKSPELKWENNKPSPLTESSNSANALAEQINMFILGLLQCTNDGPGASKNCSQECSSFEMALGEHRSTQCTICICSVRCRRHVRITHFRCLFVGRGDMHCTKMEHQPIVIIIKFIFEHENVKLWLLPFASHRQPPLECAQLAIAKVFQTKIAKFISKWRKLHFSCNYFITIRNHMSDRTTTQNTCQIYANKLPSKSLGMCGICCDTRALNAFINE